MFENANIQPERIEDMNIDSVVKKATEEENEEIFNSEFRPDYRVVSYETHKQNGDLTVVIGIEGEGEGYRPVKKTYKRFESTDPFNIETIKRVLFNNDFLIEPQYVEVDVKPKDVKNPTNKECVITAYVGRSKTKFHEFSIPSTIPSYETVAHAIIGAMNNFHKYETEKREDIG